MMKKYTDFLGQFHTKEKSSLYKTISLLCGTVFFLIILPAFFIRIGTFLDSLYSLKGNLVVMILVSITSILIGLFFLFWTTYIQLTVGKGTPVPNAPTKILIISGPYKICRNPIELGAILYYFGLGVIIQHSYTVGIICFLLALLFSSIYHKFFEEKELEKRFGEDYKRYKSEVPFIIPHFWKIIRK